MKRNMIITIAVVATLLTASLGFAGRYGNCPRQGQGRGMGQGPVLEQLTPEKQQAFQALREAFQDKMHPLRNQMWVKRTELQALSVNPNTKPETLSGLVQEMGELRNTMHQERKAFREQVRTEIGIELGEGRRGMGRGKMEMGRGRGFDGQGKGFNRPGGCGDCPNRGEWQKGGQGYGQGNGQGNGQGRGMGPRVDCPNAVEQQ